MRKAALALLALASMCVSVVAQTDISRISGFYFVRAYRGQLGTVYNGNSSTGSQTISLQSPTVTLRDGRVIYPYSVNNPITVDQGANAETVTPSSVVGCSGAGAAGQCQITATFANTHFQGTVIYSGTGGLYEAAKDAGSGGVVVIDSSFTGTTGNITAAALVYTNATFQDTRTRPVTAPTTASYPGYVAGQDFLLTGSKNGQIITDGSWSNSSSTLNSASMAQWDSTIVGQAVFATTNCRTGGAGTASGIDTIILSVPVGTVTAVNSALQIVVSTTSTSAVASNGCILIGTLQDTQMAAISTAVAANTVLCPTVDLPAGVFFVSTPPTFMTTRPTSCSKNGLVQGQEFGGKGGYIVQGKGPNSTIISIWPTLLPSACTNGAGNACFVVPGMSTWQHFRLTGNGYALNGSTDNTKYAVEMGSSYVGLFDMMFDQWGQGDTGFYGLHFVGSSGYGWVTDTVVDEFGNNGVLIAGGPAMVMRNVLIQNNCGQFTLSLSASYVYSSGHVFLQLPNICSVLTTSRTMLSLTAASYYFGGNGDVIQVGGSTVVSNGVNVDSTSNYYIRGGQAINTIATNGIAIQNSGNVHAKDAIITAGTGTGVLNQSTGSFFDDGGNSYSGTTQFNNNSGKVFGSNSATGTASATGNWALTSGWGTTTVTTAVGDSHRTLVTVTNTVAGSASPVLTWTFPKAYPEVAPVSCVLTQVGGTGSGLTTPFVPGATSKTSVAWTLGGTPGTGTYIFDANCGP